MLFKFVDFFELLSRSAGDNGWKYDVYTENVLSMSPKCLMRNQQKEVSSLISRHTAHFREKADKKLVEETLELIKDLTILKDGKRLGEKKELPIIISK